MRRSMPIFYSALLLTGVNLLLRLIGTSFQVYLSGRIGSEGIGLLQLVMSVGSMAMVAGMAGIRTAAMYLTAEEVGRKKPQNVTWVLSGCLLYSLLCSAFVALSIYIFAPFLAANWIGNSATSDSIRLFAMFLPVNCLTGVMVGYFTGANRIGTLAAVEVAEQIFSMVCTILLLSGWAGTSAEKACQSVVMGSGIGSCLTLVSLTVLRLRERCPSMERIPIGRRLASTAIPLALSDDLRTGITTVENLMVPKRLALYPGEISPLSSFGTVCGMVFPVLTFPAAVLFGLTELLIPELARCRAAGSTKRINYLVQNSLRVALLYGVICAGILYLTARELCISLYKSEDAAYYLGLFAPIAVLLYCDSVTDAMIKGLGQQTASVRYNIITNILDVVFLFFLLPKYGMVGYFLSFLVTHLVNFVLSIRRLLIITGIRIHPRIPLITLLCAVISLFIANMAPNPIISSGAYVIILFCLLFLLRVLRWKDIVWIKGLIYKK